MLPESEDGPPPGTKLGTGVQIAGTISLDLVSPPVRVRLGRDVVLRASVPEAPIEKDCHLRLREDQIGSAVQINGGPSIDAVAES